MKKLFTLLLAIAASVSMITAASVTVGGIHYDLYVDSPNWSPYYYAMVKPSTNYSGDLVIQSSVSYSGHNYKVTAIWHKAFQNCEGVTSVSIPSSIENIYDYAFAGCTGISSLNVPNSVTYVGTDAFKNILNINFHGSARGMYNQQAPWGAKCLNGYVDSIFVYSDASKTILKGCSVLATGDITIPNTVTTIGESAFENCNGLTSIVLPDNVTTIGESAFENCNGLTSIVIPDKVTTIGSSAFLNCSSITSVTIPNSVTSIGNYAFSGCSGLKSIEIPKSVKSIGEYAFEGCRGMTSVTIPDSLFIMGNGVFFNCVSLTSVTWNAIRCSDFTEAYLSPFNDVNSKITSFVIGDNVEYIPAYLCYDMKNVPQIIIPNCNAACGESAFYGCKSVLWNRLPTLSNVYETAALEYYSNAIMVKNEYDIPNSGRIEYRLSGYAGTHYYTLNGEKDASLQNLSAGNYHLVFYGDLCGDSIVKDITINRYAMKVDENYYLLDDLRHTATFTRRYMNSNTYSGDITIPKTILFNGDNYQVTGVHYDAFEGCHDILSITLQSENPIEIVGGNQLVQWRGDAADTYGYSYYRDAICVPFGSLKAYKSASGWSNHSLHVINPKHVAGTTGSTSATITFGNEEDAAHIASCGMVESDTTAGNILEYIGLEPNSEYKDIPFFIITEEGDYDTLHYSFKTPALELTTKPSQPVSGTTALLFAETNMSDAETNCGFEYKRNDAPADMDGTKVFCPVASGTMAGRLKNLKDDVYYKYRAFYQSAAGKMYYGEWQYIFTGDIAVEFDPVLYTYSATVVKETEATISGYALAGATDFTEQGFEYWAESRAEAQGSKGAMKRMPAALGEHFFVQASGINMRVTLTNLDPGTVYKYRAYGKVGDQVYYGAEQTFTTRGTYVPPTFMITFVNWDGTELQKSPVAENTMPVYLGETPVRPETNSYTYTFKGWTPQLVAATADATYTATYTAKAKQQDTVYYTITFINWDETVLQRMKVEEGEKPVYTGETPVRPEDDNYTYTFAKWSPKIVEAYEDATYMATFTAEEKSQALDNVQGDKVQGTKVIENGVLYLMYNGTKYNVQGSRVK